MPSNTGRGRRRNTCHTIKLIDPILRAGESANESANKPERAPVPPGTRTLALSCTGSDPILRQVLPIKASAF